MEEFPVEPVPGGHGHRAGRPAGATPSPPAHADVAASAGGGGVAPVLHHRLRTAAGRTRRGTRRRGPVGPGPVLRCRPHCRSRATEPVRVSVREPGPVRTAARTVTQTAWPWARGASERWEERQRKGKRRPPVDGGRPRTRPSSPYGRGPSPHDRSRGSGAPPSRPHRTPPSLRRRPGPGPVRLGAPAGGTRQAKRPSGRVGRDEPGEHPRHHLLDRSRGTCAGSVSVRSAMAAATCGCPPREAASPRWAVCAAWRLAFPRLV